MLPSPKTPRGSLWPQVKPTLLSRIPDHSLPFCSQMSPKPSFKEASADTGLATQALLPLRQTVQPRFPASLTDAGNRVIQS
jgi:hypothetical protein